MLGARAFGRIGACCLLIWLTACRAYPLSGIADLDRVEPEKGFAFGSIRIEFMENADIPEGTQSFALNPKLFHYFLYLQQGAAESVNEAAAVVEGTFGDSMEFLIPLNPGLWRAGSFVAQSVVRRFMTPPLGLAVAVEAGAATYLCHFVAVLPNRARRGVNERFRFVVENRFFEAGSKLKARFGERFTRIIDGCPSHPGPPMIVEYGAPALVFPGSLLGLAETRLGSGGAAPQAQ